MKFDSLEERVDYVSGLLIGTAGSARRYTIKELQHRIRLAAAILQDDQPELDKELQIEQELQAKYAEDAYEVQ